MMAFDPFADKVREFDLHTGDVFQVHQRPFLVTCPSDDGRGPLFVVGEDGRVRSIDECESEWRTRGVVPEMVRHIGAWRDES
jgi:hypothetical protein